MRNPQTRYACGYLCGPYYHGCWEIFSNMLFLGWSREVFPMGENRGRAGVTVFLGEDINLLLLPSPPLILTSGALCRGFHSTGEAASVAAWNLYLPLPCWSLPNLLLSILQFHMETKPRETPSYAGFETLIQNFVKKSQLPARQSRRSTDELSGPFCAVVKRLLTAGDLAWKGITRRKPAHNNRCADSMNQGIFFRYSSLLFGFPSPSFPEENII